MIPQRGIVNTALLKTGDKSWIRTHRITTIIIVKCLWGVVESKSDSCHKISNIN